MVNSQEFYKTRVLGFAREYLPGIDDKSISREDNLKLVLRKFVVMTNQCIDVLFRSGILDKENPTHQTILINELIQLVQIPEMSSRIYMLLKNSDYQYVLQQKQSEFTQLLLHMGEGYNAYLDLFFDSSVWGQYVDMRTFLSGSAKLNVGLLDRFLQIEGFTNSLTETLEAAAAEVEEASASSLVKHSHPALIKRFEEYYVNLVARVIPTEKRENLSAWNSELTRLASRFDSVKGQYDENKYLNSKDPIFDLNRLDPSLARMIIDKTNGQLAIQCLNLLKSYSSNQFLTVALKLKAGLMSVLLDHDNTGIIQSALNNSLDGHTIVDANGSTEDVPGQVKTQGTALSLARQISDGKNHVLLKLALENATFRGFFLSQSFKLLGHIALKDSFTEDMVLDFYRLIIKCLNESPDNFTDEEGEELASSVEDLVSKLIDKNYLSLLNDLLANIPGKFLNEAAVEMLREIFGCKYLVKEKFENGTDTDHYPNDTIAGKLLSISNGTDVDEGTTLISYTHNATMYERKCSYSQSVVPCKMPENTLSSAVVRCHEVPNPAYQTWMKWIGVPIGGLVGFGIVFLSTGSIPEAAQGASNTVTLISEAVQGSTGTLPPEAVDQSIKGSNSRVSRASSKRDPAQADGVNEVASFDIGAVERHLKQYKKGVTRAEYERDEANQKAKELSRERDEANQKAAYLKKAIEQKAILVGSTLFGAVVGFYGSKFIVENFLGVKSTLEICTSVDTSTNQEMGILGSVADAEL